ncbi:Cytochrome monooygenase 2 like protein [Verticillium longisporum]|uniref:Cytochrome monooygenase 2 like protein n=1 Tax=Verticillium longisporum TaxID=100787 RepID=A0A8I2ZD68_VERLO|nr:Cytochrome monooygenase 2 like protein [Verticillium longisporum]
MESSSSAPTQPPLLGSWAESTPMAQLDAQQLLYLGLALVVALASCARALGSKEDSIPCLNPSKRPLIFGKDPAASKSFTTNARGMLAEGRKRFPGQPFRITSDSGETTILPPSLINDIRNEPGLSFMKAISETFHTHLPGFEPFATGNRADSLIQVVVRKQLTKLLKWKEFVLKTEILDLVARLSSRVFLGPEVARNEDWLSITKSYTIHGFLAAEQLRNYSPWWRRLANQFLPECRLVRRQLVEAREIIGPVVQKRRDDRQQAVDRGLPPPAFNDALDWFEAESHGSAYDAAICQLSLSTAAIHTTTDLLTEVMFNIAKHPEIVADLRQEIVSILTAEGWKKTALYNLKLLDSVVKESQRMRPVGLVSMMRTATRDVPLSNGMVLRKGQRTAVDMAQMRDPSVYDDPDTFDAYRFVRMRDTPGQENQAHFVSTGPASLGFGHGQHACPGRFFAANEVKVALCHLVMKYEWKLAPGCEPKASEFGFSLAVDMNAKVLMRRREPELDIDAL